MNRVRGCFWCCMFEVIGMGLISWIGGVIGCGWFVDYGNWVGVFGVDYLGMDGVWEVVLSGML